MPAGFRTDLSALVLWTTLFACLPGQGCDAGRSRNSGAIPVPDAGTTVSVPQFNGDSAFALLVQQTEFGPRAPGSPGHATCLAFLTGELSASADTVLVQQFPHLLPDGRNIQGYNVIARFRPGLEDRILLSAHWDTRPWADEDPMPSNRGEPILGANDGASGTAVLLQTARHLSVSSPPIGVDVVLFDLEDLGSAGVPDSWSLGARHFAANAPADASYRFGINIDMIGDSNLQIRREMNSEAYAPVTLDHLFNTASHFGLYQFINEPGDAVFDDHIPLNQAGIPTVNLIDFDYPDETNAYWHTLQDTPDKCSPESLGAVGTLLLQVIYGQRTNP